MPKNNMNMLLTNDGTHVTETIRAELSCFLQFIQERKLDITGNKGLLPNHCLPDLNKRMIHSLNLQLKRETQRAYPHINGLYLLARTVGLVQIVQVKSKRFLVVDDVVLHRWEQYSPIEQYCNLMQVWFFYSDTRLIDNGRRPANNPGYDIIRFIQNHLKKNLVFKHEKEQNDSLHWITPFNLALLEMFGLVSIEYDDNLAYKSWLISKISLTEFGMEFITHITKGEWIVSAYVEKSTAIFYKKLKRLFPMWEDCWKPEQKETNQGQHIFNVSLSKKIWRRVSIQGSESLDVLAKLILDSFNFDNDHLYRFNYVDRFGVSQFIHHYELDDDPPYTDEFNVGDMDILPGDTVEFLFDFGDKWLFNLQLEEINTGISGKPIRLETVGEAPEQYPDYDEDY